MTTIEHNSATGFYVFEDVAERFWPGDFDHGNHDAEERIIEAMVARGCERVAMPYEPQSPACTTPAGVVGFDSESGMFECHAPTREPVEYVVGIIEELSP